MDNPSALREFFEGWPKQLPRRGVVVTSFDEQIPFENFLTRKTIILLERRAPDALGARKVILPYEQILAVKIVDPVKLNVFQAAGFLLPDANASGTAPPQLAVPS